MRGVTRRIASTVGALVLSSTLFGCVSLPAPEQTDSASEGTSEQTDSYDFRREILLEENQNHTRLTDKEQNLDEVLQNLKAQALIKFGEGSAFGIHDWDTPEVGQTSLHQFLSAMPKGADLHAHDLSFVPADLLVDTVASMGDVLVKLDDTEGGVRASFYTASAGAPEGAVPVGAAIAGGIVDHESLTDLITIDSGLTHEQAFRELADIEEGLSGLWSDPSIAAEICAQGLFDYVRSGVRIVELRLTLTADDAVNLAKLSAVQEAYLQVRANESDFRLRVIACADTTSASSDEVIETLRSAIRLSTQVTDDADPANPEPLIIGLDLIGDEDASDPLSAYADFLCSDEVTGSGLRLFLSCGETLATDNVAVVDAYLMGAARVGGALSLRRFPALLESYIQDGIAIETYPVATWRLGLADDLRLHPAESYLCRQGKVVLATDYAGLVEPCALTDDYLAATLAWDLTLSDLKQLALSSIECSGLSARDIAGAKDRWEADWDAFVDAQLMRPTSTS